MLQPMQTKKANLGKALLSAGHLRTERHRRSHQPSAGTDEGGPGDVVGHCVHRDRRVSGHRAPLRNPGCSMADATDESVVRAQGKRLKD